jgi:hypothetical protein
MSSDEEAVSREVAWRVFAREYDDADFAFKEGEDERAPNYVATPTGAKINRLFVVGVLTEVERVGEGDLLRARVSDPTGAFVVYAGQYQPDAVSFLADAETPEFVAVVGKARTYEPEDSDDVYTSIRPEEMNVVDAETRDRWNVETARETLRRIEAVRDYLRNGVTPETHPELHELGEVVDHYATDEAYLNELEREAREVLTEVAGVEAAEVGAGGTTETDEDEVGGVGKEAETAGNGSESQTATETTKEEVTSEAAQTSAEGGSDDVGDETEEDGSEDKDDFSDIEQEDIGDDEEVGDWEWDEGQREEVEEEFGAEFETGAEFAEEEETEEPKDAKEGDAEDTEEVEKEAEVTEADDEEEKEAKEAEQEEATDESAETVVMNIIEDESGDDGVERSQIVAKATESGLEEDVAEATLEDLLLEGMCYPTDGDRIKPI